MVHCNYFHIFFFSFWHTDRTSVQLLTWVSTIILYSLHPLLTLFLHLAADSHLLPVSSSPSHPSSIQLFAFLLNHIHIICPPLFSLRPSQGSSCRTADMPPVFFSSCSLFTYLAILTQKICGTADRVSEVWEFGRVKHIQAESPPRAQPATATPDRVPEFNLAHGPGI